MGLLNFPIFHGIFEQRYHAYIVPFQIETTRVEWQEVAQRFPSPIAPTSPENSWVRHYTNAKPFTQHKRYSAAMTHFRKQALYDTHQKTGLAEKIALMKEDMRVHGPLLYTKNRPGLSPTRPVG